MVIAPYRVAFARPRIAWAGDPARDAAASLILWCDLYERTLEHPRLAVLSPAELGVAVSEGAVVPAPERGESAALLAAHRRDEVLWLELAAADGEASLRAVLHARRAGDKDGDEETFAAIGEAGDIGDVIDRALDLWIEARGLAALPGRGSLSAADVAAVLAALAPAIAERARARQPIEPSAGGDEDEAGGETESAVNAEIALPALDGLSIRARIAGWRAFERCVPGARADEAILVVAPEDLHAIASRIEQTPVERRELARVRAALARAPMSMPLLRLLAAAPDPDGGEADPEAPTELERLGAAGAAAASAPRDPESRRLHNAALRRAGRFGERLRNNERTRDENRYWPSAWLPLLASYPPLETVGAWDHVAGRAANTVGLVIGGVPQPWNPWSMRVDLHASDALLAAGLLGEAIVLRANRLEGLEGRFPREAEILEGWRKQARHVAWAFAREGYFRGEDARVLEGFSRAEPRDGVDLAMLMESLLVCGRAREALLAWAHLGLGRGLASPRARLAAVRVLLAGERHRDGFELRLRALLGEPRRGDRLTLDRDAALLRHAPLEDLESLVSKWSEMGAATLAAAAAREIADFVIGAASSSATCAHLRRGETELDFEASWLAGFDPIPGRAAIDQLFAAALDPLAGEPGERADRLVDQWTAVRFSAIAQDDRAGLRRATAYLFAQALGRYLALATRPPSILAGALRTVAGEALAALGAARDELALEDVEAILATIEGAAGAPAELVDGWLLRIEEALRLEERTGGRLETLTATAPRVAGLLRGPEAISLETLAAARALRDPEARASADTGALLARIASATGAASAPAWAEAGAANPGPEGLDVLLTAAFLCEGGLHAGPAVLAAERLLASGESELACDLLCRGLAGAPGEAWRDEQLAALRPLWIESGLDVPFDFNAAAPAALERLQHGDGAGAARILRWLAAVDPGNAELHRNYGIARAIQGDIEAALTHFARASSDQDTQFAAGTLFQAGHPTLAMEVLDYASRWYTRAEQWLTFGAIAFQVMDNPRTMIAYSAAWELDPDAYDASNLNSWAGVLDEVGDYDRCEKIARRLIDAAGEDAMWASNGWHHLACAFIGQGKLEDATAAATRAIEMNPLPENEGVFAQTLERARSGERPPVPPELPPPVPRHPAYLALEDGDVKAIAESLAGDGDWEARLAVLRAARFRFGSDNYVEVTGKALETAERLIADSRGASELVARVARVFALEVREQALFARDPMPMLGDRGTRQAFYKEFRDRGGIIVGEPPAAEVAFEDREVCPGTALPRASDYVALLAALAAGTPAGAIAGTGLDEEAYHAAAAAWGQALRRDPSLGQLLAAGLRQRG